MSIEAYTSWEDIQVLILANANRNSEARLRRLLQRQKDLELEIKEQEDSIKRIADVIEHLKKRYRISIRES